jgi:hypothetical protein
MKSKMSIRLILVSALLVLDACNTQRINYNSMSDLEIKNYNLTVGQWDKVYCSMEIRLESRIPRRKCATLLELQGQQIGDISRINTANPGSSKFGVN